MNTFKSILLAFTICGLGACCSTDSRHIAANNPPQAQTLPDNYMPEWNATRFDEAEACGEGVLPKGRYRAAVVEAMHGNQPALEEVISCSFSPRCDAAAGELHAGVMERLMLMRGDMEFSKALAAVKARHGGKYPAKTFLMSEQEMRRFFPLTAGVYYGPGNPLPAATP